VWPKHTACVDGINKKNVLWWRVKCILLLYHIGTDSAKIKIISASQDYHKNRKKVSKQYPAAMLIYF
jgi:hypothetical protein